MSTDPSGAPGGPGAGGGGAPGQPREEDRSEIDQRAAYEAELSRITSADMMLQAAVSLLNIGSYRLAGPPPAAEGASQVASGRDVEQVRDAIDAVKALLEILERRIPGELAPLRNALSQLQMAYAREMQASGPEPPSGADAAGQGEPQPASGGAPGAKPQAKPGEGGGDAAGEQGSSGPGPAESSGRLWVPGR